jgi:hypothetical protein
VARDPIAAAAKHAGRAALSPALSAHAPRGPTTARRRARAECVLVARPGSCRAQRLPAPPTACGADGEVSRTGRTRRHPHPDHTTPHRPCTSLSILARTPPSPSTNKHHKRPATSPWSPRVVNFKPLASPVGEEEDL